MQVQYVRENRCSNIRGLFTTKVITSHVKLHVKSADAQKECSEGEFTDRANWSRDTFQPMRRSACVYQQTHPNIAPVSGGRSSSSLSIFFSEEQNRNFSSFSLTRSESLFFFEHEVQRRSLDYFDHFARDHLYTFEVLPSLSQQGTLILNLQSLRQKKIMRQKTKVH